MTEEERINELEGRVEQLEKRIATLSSALASSIYQTKRLADLNDTFYDNRDAKKDIIIYLETALNKLY